MLPSARVEREGRMYGRMRKWEKGLRPAPSEQTDDTAVCTSAAQDSNVGLSLVPSVSNNSKMAKSIIYLPIYKTLLIFVLLSYVTCSS